MSKEARNYLRYQRKLMTIQYAETGGNVAVAGTLGGGLGGRVS